MHHKIIFGTISWQKIIDDSDKRPKGGLSYVIKKLVINWWACQTHVSPNKRVMA
jgi:hypothetical protein